MYLAINCASEDLPPSAVFTTYKLEEYFRKCAAAKNDSEPTPPLVGLPKTVANSDSFPIRTGVSGPQLKSPTIAPVVDVTAGTTPVRSISRIETAGDSENLRVIIVSFYVKV